MVANDNSSKNLYAAPGNAADRNIPDTAERDGAYIPETDEHGYRINEQPYGTKRCVKVILMGAGASTLNFLKQAEEELENVDITVYEKNNDIGGTWLEVCVICLVLALLFVFWWWVVNADVFGAE